MILLQAYSVRQSVADKAHQVKDSVQGEFEKMKPRNSEDQAWTQGRIVGNTPEVEQRPTFHGSARRIIVDPVDPPETKVRFWCCDALPVVYLEIRASSWKCLSNNQPSSCGNVLCTVSPECIKAFLA